MSPFGEHKGSGLALVCELLAGAIVGSATVTTPTPPERGIINGMLSIVIERIANGIEIDDTTWAQLSATLK